MRIAMAQINATVGDLEGNIKKIEQFIDRAKRHKVDLVARTSLFLMAKA